MASNLSHRNHLPSHKYSSVSHTLVHDRRRDLLHDPCHLTIDNAIHIYIKIFSMFHHRGGVTLSANNTHMTNFSLVQVSLVLRWGLVLRVDVCSHRLPVR